MKEFNPELVPVFLVSFPLARGLNILALHDAAHRADERDLPAAVVPQPQDDIFAVVTLKNHPQISPVMSVGPEPGAGPAGAAESANCGSMSAAIGASFPLYPAHCMNESCERCAAVSLPAVHIALRQAQGGADFVRVVYRVLVLPVNTNCSVSS